MDEIKALTQINYVLFVLWFFAILFAAKEAIEIFSYFKKKFRIKTGTDEDKETVIERIARLEKHDKIQYDKLSELSNGINEIKTLIVHNEDSQNKVTVATCRSTLYRLHKEFVSQKYVTQEGLKTFLEIGKVYEDAGGDDIFHDKLKPEVMELEIKD